MPTDVVQDLQLRLRDSAGTYVFSFPGELETLDQQRVFQEFGAVPELAKLIETMEASRCRIVAADTKLLFEALATFEAFVNDRTGTPLTAIELVRPAAGGDAEEIVRTISSPTYQNIRLESVSVDDEIPALEGARLRSVLPMTLRFSAELAFPDGNGIVLWDQRIVNTYRNGLHSLEYQVELETAEGTDARTKAKQFAKIHIDTFGERYVWSEETNGADGIRFDEIDAQTFNDGSGNTAARVPTRVVCASKIEQLGFAVGANSPGNSINKPIVLRTETVIEGTTQTTIRTAEAHGPGCLAWVKSKALTGDLQYESVAEEEAGRGAFGTWRRVEQVAAGASWKIRAVITGAAQDEEYVPLSGVQPPLLTIGPLQRARLDVDIAVEFVGSSPTREDMPFPEKLRLPWRLQLVNSKEDAFPELVEQGTAEGHGKWQRKAQLVYEAAVAPPFSAIRELGSLLPMRFVRSYWL